MKPLSVGLFKFGSPSPHAEILPSLFSAAYALLVEAIEIKPDSVGVPSTPQSARPQVLISPLLVNAAKVLAFENI